MLHVRRHVAPPSGLGPKQEEADGQDLLGWGMGMRLGDEQAMQSPSCPHSWSAQPCSPEPERLG